MLKRVTIINILFLLLLPSFVFAQNQIKPNDWYLKSFESQIIVNYDSTLNISEKIIADASNLPDKHGIFRILPTAYYLNDNEKINTPIDSISITNWQGQKYKYQTIKSYSDEAITFKIGDKNKTVTGENYYLINYRYKNIIRFNNNNFDELYLNLNGNFWEIQTNSYRAEIILPKEINQVNSKVYIYSGRYGQKDTGRAEYYWNSDNNSIIVTSNSILNRGEGITISITFPKGIINPYQPTWWGKTVVYLYWLIILLPPFLALFFCFKTWVKYGKDPKLTKTVIAEYEPPHNLSPIELGFIYKSTKISTSFITASIVNLAVLGFIKIEEIKNNKYKFIFTGQDISQLKSTEKIILKGLFTDLLPNQEVTLDYLKNRFYKNIATIKNVAQNQLVTDGFFDESGFKYRIKFFIYSIVLFVISFVFYPEVFILFSLIITAMIIFFFGVIMTKMTTKGSETLWKIKGLKLYIKTAEKYRQEFNEKENIFEKLLPYAMVFGLVKLWVKKMKQIYGENYFNSYHPVWFYGANMTNFNINNFEHSISQLTSKMNSTMASSPSGSGGGGFSGGGGGGGGGGGW